MEIFKNTNFDFLGKKWPFIIASLVLTAAGIGTDTFYGIESIVSGAASDRLTGYSLANRLDGGAGNDILIGGLGDDTLAGGENADTADWSAATGAILFTLVTGGGVTANVAGIGKDTLFGMENLIGGSADDTLSGDDFANKLTGNGGLDKLKGRGGADQLTGGASADYLTGGDGADSFDYNFITDSTVAKAGRDIIIDFNENATDKIDLSTIDAITGGGLANDAFTFMAAGPITGLGQVKFATTATKTFVFINTTGSNAADMFIELLGVHVLDAADFIL